VSEDLTNIDDANFGDEDYTTAIDDSKTEVGSAKSSKAVRIVLLVIVAAIAGFFFYSKSGDVIEEPVKEKKVDKDGKEIKVNVAKPPKESLAPIVEALDPDISESNAAVDVPDIDIPKLPPMDNIKIDLPKTEAIIPEFKAPDINVAQIGNKDTASITPNKQQAGDQTKQSNKKKDDFKSPDFADSDSPTGAAGGKKQQQSMMLLNSGGATQSSSNDYLINPTTFASIEATKVFHTDRTIIQGKIVEAVLETAINTDFPGSVRGLVSQDVYAETGRHILIPKGSRLIGSYSGSVDTGQTRVLISWERLIRPDAVDIAINSMSTDQFGRAGVPGNVDNKYLELFNNSILLSLITVGTAIALEGATGDSELSVTEEEDGDTTTSGSATDFAADEIINTISSTADTILSNMLNVTPTITVPQGTRINVFVNQDLVFPPAKSQNGLLILE
jgi:type IV secretion system protein VirB10